MPLFSERQRLAALEAAEAAGENLWTESLSAEVRAKFLHAWQEAKSSYYRGVLNTAAAASYEKAVLKTVGSELGLVSPPSIPVALVDGRVDVVLSYVEAMVLAVGATSQKGTALQARIGEVLQLHRIAFKFVHGEFVPFESDELHANVIDPTLRLLHGRSDFGATESAYTKALKEISAGDAGDAITDAGTALQEALKALGCDGKTLGTQIGQAKTKGLLGGHDQKLIDGIEAFSVWVAAERNSGEAHKVVDQPIADAWLMVHVVGALILRLADGVPRQKLSTRD